MKIIILSICCLFSWGTTKAQNTKIDSLDQLINKAASDTERINLVIKKLDILGAINLDSAIYLGNEMLKKAQQINYYKGELKLRQKLASSYCYKGAFEQAAEHMNFLEKFIRPSEDSADFASLYANWGMMYGMQSKYDTSIYWYEKALVILEQRDRYAHLAGAYSNIAIAYQQQSNFTQALFYQQKALKKAEESKDEVNIAYTTLNIGNTYDGIGDLVRAEQNFLKAIELAKKKSLINVELYGYSNLASIYTRETKWQQVYDFAIKAANLGATMGDQGIQAASMSKAATALAMTNEFNEAVALSKKAITIADSTNLPLNIYQAYSTAGNILRLKGNYAEAIPFYEKGFLSLKDSDIYSGDNSRVYTEASDCYEKTGNYGKALEAYKIAKEINDSVSSKNNIQKATELTMNFEFDKKQELLQAKQKAKDEVSATKQIALAVGLLLTLVLAAVALIGFRNKQKANTLLEIQKKEIEHTLALLKTTQSQLIQSEKMASLGEVMAGIAHEIKNPLNFVNNFSDVSLEMLAEMKAEFKKGNSIDAFSIADDIEQNLLKITHHGKRADAIVKGMLEHSRANTGIKQLTDINSLAEKYMRLAYHGFKAKDKSFNVTMETDFDPSIGNLNLIPQEIGRVMLNLYNNAFYAITEKKKTSGSGYEPVVSLRTKKILNHFEIIVKDNGTGIPQKVVDKIFQPFFTTKPTGQGTGLGLSLSYDIIKAHQGEIRVNSKEGEGAEFVIVLPI